MPLASTVPVHNTVPVGEAVTVTNPPGVPLPEKVGVVSLNVGPGVSVVIAALVLLTLNRREAAGPIFPAASVDATMSV